MNAAVLVIGAIVGFLAARRLRRPDQAAQAAAVMRTVGGTLGRRRGLDAPELQRACFSEMVRHVRVTRQGRTHAPARYLLHLHPDDLAVVDDARRWFTEGLTEALRIAARDHGWVLEGQVDIEFVADAARHPGAPSALAVPPDALESIAAEPTEPPPAPRAPMGSRRLPRPLDLVRDDTSERVSLGLETVTIGRARDRTVTIDDKRVSRSHAQIEPLQGGWAITDLGSANGTRVNGEDLSPNRPHLLRARDVIGIGPADLRVTTGSSPRGEPGTRALDDSDRTRISAEVLPAPGRPNG